MHEALFVASQGRVLLFLFRLLGGGIGALLLVRHREGLDDLVERASFPSLPERFAWELHQSTRAFFAIWSYFLRTFCAFRYSPAKMGLFLIIS